LKIREKLESRGISFRTTSDTEVLLECLIEYGIEETLPTLEGMFAFALFDKHSGSMVIARDRYGQKPLFFYEDHQTILFASEVKAIGAYVGLEPDLFSISSYLHGFGAPTKNQTFFRNVKILPPGGMIKVNKGKSPQYENYFSISDFRKPELVEHFRSLTSTQIVDAIEDLLIKSVKKHLIADAPVGALCSGGVDSSLILAIAAKSHGNLAIFHSKINGPDSEYDAAFTLSKHLNLDLVHVEVRNEDLIHFFPETMDHYEHPFTYNPSSIPFFMVSRLASDHHVKGLLSGEGSDECYLGYSWLKQTDPLLLNYRLRRILKKWLSVTPIVKTLLRFESESQAEFVRNLQNRFEICLENAEIKTRAELNKEGKDWHLELKSLELLNYRLRTLLHRNDSLGMAASIEARFPFLDNNLVEAAVNLPYRAKIRLSFWPLKFPPFTLQDKWVIRQVAKRYLPREFSDRPKWGFRVRAVDRMRISGKYFKNSIIRDLLGLSCKQVEYLTNHAPQRLMMRLLHLDVWGHVCLYNLSKDQIRTKLLAHCVIPEA
jgi:asparagine synthase (glutamine-hydrolysing)